MPLIDLRTSLKDLKYGVAAFDRRDSGWSGQPYMQFPIDDENAPNNIRNFYSLNRTGLDYPIRGGSTTIQLGSRTVTLSAEIDKTRIRKFLSDKPRGDAFIKKQIGLQLTNPKMETGTSVNIFGQNINGYNILENTRLYNDGLNTLEQVGYAGSGLHIQRQGLMPIDTVSKYYAKTVGSQLTMDSERVRLENRLLLLQQLKLTPVTRESGVLGGINKINQLGLSLDRNIIQNYLGGPGSVYGIGSTTIRRYEDTTKAATEGFATYDQIYTKKTRGASRRMRSVVGLENLLVADQDTIDYRFYTYGTDSIVDKINVKDIGALNTGDPWTNGNANDDLIKFGFECLSNDEVGSSMFLQFRALLTSGITDGHQATINAFKYIGRGEDFYIYEGFTRNIQYAFRIAAQSKDELLPLYSKLNALASQVYPDYSNSGIMRSSVVKITVGDYFYRVPGLLESVNITIANETSWDIEDGRQLPHYLDVSISFKPIHSMLPKRFMRIGGKQLPEDETILANTTLQKYNKEKNTESLKANNTNIGTISSNIPTNNTAVSSFATNLVNRTLLQNANNEFDINQLRFKINRELRPQ
jgi:hypothetical protein